MFKHGICVLCMLLIVGACAKHDPILSGTRHNIFKASNNISTNKIVHTLSENIKNIYGDDNCVYTQDSSNIIWKNDVKLFTGFATTNFVNSDQSPICAGNFIYTGLSTGEVIKYNVAKNQLVWTSDVYKDNNLTGGFTIVDIVAHVGLDGHFVYAGGLGDAFCKIRSSDGFKLWCLEISVPVDFIIIDDFAFVVGTDNMLYAINTDNGIVYWRTHINDIEKPKYNGRYIIVGSDKIDYTEGTVVK